MTAPPPSPPNRASPTPRLQSSLDKTWGQRQKLSIGDLRGHVSSNSGRLEYALEGLRLLCGLCRPFGLFDYFISNCAFRCIKRSLQGHESGECKVLRRYRRRSQLLDGLAPFLTQMITELF